MSSYFAKLNQKSLMISSKNPKKQTKYLKYYHAEGEEMCVVLKLDKVIITKSKDKEYLKDFLFITRIDESENI